MNPSCQAILFDLVGVLLHCRTDYVPGAIVEAIDTLIGQVTDDKCFRHEIFTTYALSEAEFEQILASIVEKYEPFQPLWELLPELRAHYKLGILNNGTYLTYPLFNARLGLERQFDLFLSSGREGVCKPDVRFYERACQRLGVSSKECLFMDDSMSNLESARRLGMQGIFWEDADLGFKLFTEWLKNEKSHGIALANLVQFLL